MTKTELAVIRFLTGRQNVPASMYELLSIGSVHTVTASVNNLLDDGILERVPEASQVKLKLTEAAYQEALS